jgi:hypothetical protein
MLVLGDLEVPMRSSRRACDEKGFIVLSQTTSTMVTTCQLPKRPEATSVIGDLPRWGRRQPYLMEHTREGVCVLSSAYTRPQ